MSNEVTRTEFARLRGFKPSYVTELAKAGRLVLSDDGKRVKVAESVARIEATRDPSKQAVADRHAANRGAAPARDETPETEELRYQDARAKREHFMALQAELDYRKAARELLEAGEVVGALSDVLTVLRNRFESMPDVLAPQLAAEMEEQKIRAMLADEVEIALGEVSSRFADLGKADA